MIHEMIIKDLTVTYQHKKVLDTVNVRIVPGQITGIIGPNGAGKSTFLKGFMGLIKRESGQVTIDGRDIHQHKEKIAYVEQRSLIDLTFPINVAETVLLGTYPTLGLFKRLGRLEKLAAQEALEKVKMYDFAKRQIGQLSGGQLQRVFIARALAQKADIILLDEPFVGIDMVSEKLIVDLLKELRDEGKTIIIVHHDLHRTREYFDQLIILNQQLIAAGTVDKVFTTTNIRQAYGESMGDIEIKGVGHV